MGRKDRYKEKHLNFVAIQVMRNRKRFIKKILGTGYSGVII